MKPKNEKSPRRPKKRRRSASVIRKERQGKLQVAIDRAVVDAMVPPAAAGGAPCPRQIVLKLPCPWSINDLLRARYDLRNKRRELLKKRISKLRPPGWSPLKRFRVDALISVPGELRDPLELPASLKIEMDALQECGIIAGDGPKNVVVGDISQIRARPTGVLITLTELP